MSEYCFVLCSSELMSANCLVLIGKRSERVAFVPRSSSGLKVSREMYEVCPYVLGWWMQVANAIERKERKKFCLSTQANISNTLALVCDECEWDSM